MDSETAGIMYIYIQALRRVNSFVWTDSALQFANDHMVDVGMP